MRGTRFLIAFAMAAPLLLGACATSRAPEPEPPPIPEPRTPDSPRVPDVDEAREAEERAERAEFPSVAGSGDVWLVDAEVVAELLFASGSAELTSAARRELDALVARLAERTDDYRLEIEGHSDGAGDEFENRLLAAHRADAVRSYLGAYRSIPLESIGLRSIGEESPVADDASARGRALNRRVVVLLGRPPG